MYFRIFIYNSNIVLFHCRLFRTTVFTQRNFSDTKSIEYVVPVREKELSLTPDSNSKITIYGPVNIASVNGVPEEHLKGIKLYNKIFKNKIE